MDELNRLNKIDRARMIELKQLKHGQEWNMKENSRMMNGMDKNDGGSDRVQIEMNKMDHDLDLM